MLNRFKSFSQSWRPSGEGVLVTGCSSGIGRATAIQLAESGLTVFATVRKERDAEQLRQLGNPNLVSTYPLDLTRLTDIPPLVDFVSQEMRRRGKEGLFAIVNNAGGGSIAPIELMDVARFRLEAETRLIGPVALLQAFLPLIRQAHGRIVWIVTPALMPIRYVSSIHANDFAANCLARTLQLELKPWNIPSIQVRCGGINTAAPTKTDDEFAASFKQWPSERFKLYAAALEKEQVELAKFDEKRTEPQEVAKVVLKALIANKPKARYQIGYMAGVAALAEYLPQPLLDWVLSKRA
jgi:NAD(P)-dependent dehydrogenase (short-subunit alcohol dehydrogenase family)